MIDVKKPLRQKYVEIVSGLDYPIYDMFAPDDAPDSYVVINSMFDRQDRSKCDMHVTSVTLELVYRTMNHGGSLVTDNIAEDVLPAIILSAFDLGPTLECYGLRMTSDRSLSGFSSTHNIYRRLIEFEHRIKEL